MYVIVAMNSGAPEHVDAVIGPFTTQQLANVARKQFMDAGSTEDYWVVNLSSVQQEMDVIQAMPANKEAD